ncbi:MAG: single-stranded DNA-binding protein [Actinomycetes bacterium]
MTSTGDDTALATPTNVVQLVGRLAAPPEERVLPSGDVLVSFRLIVDRPPSRTLKARDGQRSGPTVDTFDCAVWSAGLRKRVSRLEQGEVLHLEGSLRRRFWRAGGAAASRVEVDVAALRRLKTRSGG